MSDELAVQFCDKSGNIAVQFCDKSGNIGVQFCHPPAPCECPCDDQENWDKLASGEIEECGGLVREYRIQGEVHAREMQESLDCSGPIYKTYTLDVVVSAVDGDKCRWKYEIARQDDTIWRVILSLATSEPCRWYISMSLDVDDEWHFGRAESSTGSVPPDGVYNENICKIDFTYAIEAIIDSVTEAT